MNTNNRIQLPQPTGPHAIGVIDFAIVDASREESFKPGTHRRIPVRAWYPAASVSGEPRPYANALELEHHLPRTLHLLPNAADVVPCFDRPSHAYEGAPPKALGPCPTVIYSHGANSYPQQNTPLMEHLASHGYLVLSISHPYTSAAVTDENGEVILCTPEVDTRLANMDPDWMNFMYDPDPGARLDGHLRMTGDGHFFSPYAPAWQADLISVLDALDMGELPGAGAALAGLVDTQRIAYIGMSFGGTGLVAAHKDERVKCAVNLDGGLFDETLYDCEARLPILSLLADVDLMWPGQNSFPFTEFLYEKLDSIGSRSDIQRLEIKGTTHASFQDASLAPREILGPIAQRNDGPGMAVLINDLVTPFLEQYLNGNGSGINADLLARYPDVQPVDLTHVREWAATSPKPVFMGPTHVLRMNRLTLADENTRLEVAKLDKRYVLAYELTDAPQGTEWWLLVFDPEVGMYFDLRAPIEGEADLTFRGDYAEYIQFIQKASAGEVAVEDEPVERIGNVQMIETIGPAFAAGRAVAGMPAQFPEVEELSAR